MFFIAIFRQRLNDKYNKSTSAWRHSKSAPRRQSLRQLRSTNKYIQPENNRHRRKETRRRYICRRRDYVSQSVGFRTLVYLTSPISSDPN